MTFEFSSMAWLIIMSTHICWLKIKVPFLTLIVPFRLLFPKHLCNTLGAQPLELGAPGQGTKVYGEVEGKTDDS